MENFIFWQQALRVAGPAIPANAEARLRDMLSIRRFGIGVAVAFITLFWIYASSQMRHTQIEYIEARLNEAVAA